MKKCFKCGKAQPLAEFYKHPPSADGYLGKCKTCTKLDTKKNREVNGESIRTMDRERNKLPHRKEHHKAKEAKWKVNNPGKKNIHLKVHRALRSGKIVKKPCSVCGDKNVHGHHEDYSKPLEVIWLCPLHHAEIHKLNN